MKGKILLLIVWIWGVLGINSLAATPVELNGRLLVSGSKIVNEKGKAFVIKGVSTHGIAWYPEYVNKKAFQNLRDQWGVNTVRLALYTAEYHGYCTGGDKKELMRCLNNGVKYATELGMYVIIDWHILSDGNPLTHRKQAEAFFKDIASRYRGYENVLYEICNEPNGTGGSWKNIKSYARSIIKTIRKLDKKAIIIVGTPTWSQDVDQAEAAKITGYANIAYALHFYAGTHQDALRTKAESAIKKGLPVIVTEFGITDASGNGAVNKAQGNKWITLLDTYQIGRVCWNLSNKNESSALLKSSCGKKNGWTYSDLSEQGKWLVKTYKGKMAGNSDKTTGTTQAGKVTKQEEKNKDETAETVSQSEGKKTKIETTCKITNRWSNNGKYYTQFALKIKNSGTETLKNWKVRLTFNQPVKVESGWCARYVSDKKTLSVTSLSWNKVLEIAQSTEIGFILVTTNQNLKVPSQVIGMQEN